MTAQPTTNHFTTVKHTWYRCSYLGRTVDQYRPHCQTCEWKGATTGSQPGAWVEAVAHAKEAS